MKLSYIDNPVSSPRKRLRPEWMLKDSKATWTSEEGATVIEPIFQTTESGNPGMISPGQADTTAYRITANDNEDLYARLTTTVGAYDSVKFLRVLGAVGILFSLKSGAARTLPRAGRRVHEGACRDRAERSFPQFHNWVFL